MTNNFLKEREGGRKMDKATREKLKERGYKVVTMQEFSDFFLFLHERQEIRLKKINEIKRVVQDLRLDPGIYIVPLAYKTAEP
ncbi:hypothetical protein KKF23_04835 [Patescibacteria group bacterium]|nr:hypothetical protein [Patescibacteria group bacterium]